MTIWNRRTFLRSSAQAAALTTLPLSNFAPGQKSSAAGTFPKDFHWGASTAAMQVEGSPYADGGGRSIWAAFEAKPGNIKDGSTNWVADDEYHRYAEDIGHMRELGLNSYRFSLGWPRILPQGRIGSGAQPNEAGLAYYDKLIDGLLEAKITPFVTIYHFDYPDALQQQGGWLNDDSSKWLADYAHLVVSRFSDRVTNWLTINEPNILWGFGAEAGAMPPALKLGSADLAKGCHNLLLGHGRSVQAIRAAAKKPAKVGLPFAGMLSLPASASAQDVAAARTASFSVEKRTIIPLQPAMTLMNNSWWLDPIYLGHYPAEGYKLFPTAEKLATPADMKTIHQPVDYCAINLYFAPTVKAGADGKPEPVPDSPTAPRSHYGWAITPELLYWAPKLLHERYRKPILVTENGVSLADAPAPDGKVHDPQRTAFLNSYLGAYKRAHQDGVPLAGYLHWSLIDNWEFSQGYGERFGLIYVDRKTQTRIVKDSAYRYKEIVASNGAVL
jgi:beta-glucosidase